MSKRYARYDADGRITACVMSTRGKPNEPRVFEIDDNADDVDLYYYARFINGVPVLTKKRELDLSYTRKGLSIMFPLLPEGTLVKVAKESLVSDKQGAEVEFEMPGVYRFLFYPPPQYMDEKLEVTVD